MDRGQSFPCRIGCHQIQQRRLARARCSSCGEVLICLRTTEKGLMQWHRVSCYLRCCHPAVTFIYGTKWYFVYMTVVPGTYLVYTQKQNVYLCWPSKFWKVGVLGEHKIAHSALVSSDDFIFYPYHQGSRMKPEESLPLQRQWRATLGHHGLHYF